MGELRAGSPTSDVFSDDVDSSSVKERSPLQSHRPAVKHHGNGFKAGYVPVNETTVNSTGVRGRKTFAFWTLVVLLFILAIGNLILTITILGVLRLGQGMQSIELLPEEAIKFFGETDLGHLYKRDGLLEGFKDEPVSIAAEDGGVYLNLVGKSSRPANKVAVGKNGTVVRGVDWFSVRNRLREVLFSTRQPHFHALRPAKALDAGTLETSRVSSPLGHRLRVEARNQVHLKGSEGTRMHSREVIINVDQEMYLRTLNGSIVLNGTDGTFIDVNKIPIAMVKPSKEIHFQYKLCVCMPQGKLFKIPVFGGSGARVYCHHINMSSHNNPCI